MRAINADELLTAFPHDDEQTVTKSSVRMTIERMPTLDVVPVVHAYWTGYEPFPGEGESIFQCSACHFVIQLINGTPKENSYKHCPRCGAAMDEVVK